MRRLISLLCLCLTYDSYCQEFVPYSDRAMRLVQGISFSEDGNTLYFALPHKEYLQTKGESAVDAPRLAIYSAERNGNSWSEPVMLSFSGVSKDYEPTISPSGKWLFFNSNRTLLGDTLLKKNDIWFSAFKKGSWQLPQALGKLNTMEWEESYPSISRKGHLIYVAETPSDSNSNYGLYETRFKGVHTRPGKLLNLVNLPYECGDPWISPKGDYLIFTRYDPNNWNASCDLYISFKHGSKWTPGVALEELNSTGPDFSPTIGPDERWIYFRQNFLFKKFDFKSILQKYRLNHKL